MECLRVCSPRDLGWDQPQCDGRVDPCRGVKKDLKDHMNSLEKRVLATGKAEHDSGGDAGGTTTRDAQQGVEPGLQPQLPGDGNEALLRRIVREELEKLITTRPQQ